MKNRVTFKYICKSHLVLILRVNVSVLKQNDCNKQTQIVMVINHLSSPVLGPVASVTYITNEVYSISVVLRSSELFFAPVKFIICLLESW